MQYVWQHRLWPAQHLHTVEGKRVQIIDPGRLNTDSGPDFFNAKVKIDGHLWAGDIEIHVKASDWHRHHHDGDPAYDSVILHVVDRDDTMIRRSNGEVIPQMQMPCSPTLNADYHSLIDRADIDLPCSGYIHEIPSIYITDWMSALVYERLYAKSDHIDHLLEMNTGDSESTCYVMLARALGFGINADPFERLARAIPLRFIARHRGELTHIEAILFGQSGLLDPYLNPQPGVTLFRHPYIDSLVNEYRFLSAKYGMKPLTSAGWKMGRMRPQNFPHRRIAMLAHLLNENYTLYSRIIALTDVDEARTLFDTNLTGFWTFHYQFSETARSSTPQRLSNRSIDLLVINLVVPLMFNHALHHGDDAMAARAVEMLHDLAAERNTIIEMFGRAGIPARNAAHSQALIHLRRNYCEQHKCLYCRLGHRYLSTCARRPDA